MTDHGRWCVVVSRNALDLLKQALLSIEGQDVPVGVVVVDNDSTDGTRSWLYSRPKIHTIHLAPQHSVSRAWNTALNYLFAVGVERALVVNQDVVLRPDTYRWLETEMAVERADFVTGVGSADRNSLKPLPRAIEYHDPRDLEPSWTSIDDPLSIADTLMPIHRSLYPIPRADAKRPHPDFSCFMISRYCYKRVGPFDENFLGGFCEDADYHVRMHLAGIDAYSIDLPFWHVGGGSQTIKRADPDERRRISEQAQRNREYFRRKWGFEVPTPENGGRDYYTFFDSEPPE